MVGYIAAIVPSSTPTKMIPLLICSTTSNKYDNKCGDEQSCDSDVFLSTSVAYTENIVF